MYLVYDQLAKLYNKKCKTGPVKSSQEYNDQLVELKEQQKTSLFQKVDKTLFAMDLYSDALLNEIDINLKNDNDTNRYIKIFTELESGVAKKTS